MTCPIDKIYSPQIFGGGVGSGLTPPPASPPSFLDNGFITVSYPYDDPELSIQFRPPEFNDSKVVYPVRNISRTRNNDLSIATDTTWPIYTRLKYSIISISEEAKALWVTFVNASLGKEIRLIDYEDQLWRGLILNPESPITQETRGCGYSIQIDFEGELQ